MPAPRHLPPRRPRTRADVWIYFRVCVYTAVVAKHLVDVDEERLGAARAALGTRTIKDTVNEALGLAAAQRAGRVASALDILASAPLADRAEMWR